MKNEQTEPTSVGGYFSTDKFFSMSHTEFIDYCVGLSILSIGKGEFRQAIVNTIDMANARGIRHEIERRKKE